MATTPHNIGPERARGGRTRAFAAVCCPERKQKIQEGSTSWVGPCLFLSCLCLFSCLSSPTVIDFRLFGFFSRSLFSGCIDCTLLLLFKTLLLVRTSCSTLRDCKKPETKRSCLGNIIHGSQRGHRVWQRPQRFPIQAADHSR